MPRDIPDTCGWNYRMRWYPRSMTNDGLDISARKGLIWASRWFQLLLVVVGAAVGCVGYWFLLEFSLQLTAPGDLLVPLGVVFILAAILAFPKMYRRYSLPFAAGVMTGGISATAFFIFLFGALAEGFGARF